MNKGVVLLPHWSVGVAVNMPLCRRVDHGFESRTDRQGNVVQRQEQQLPNLRVEGSSPSIPAKSM
jgi:hypothetical protein